MAESRSGTPAEQRAREIRAAVDLLSDAERAAAAVALRLPPDSDVATVAAALTAAPRADSLRALAAAAPDVMTMLKDITEWLEGHGASARTTGFMLALDRSEETVGIDLSAQEVQLVCSWPDRLDGVAESSFAQLLRDWRRLAARWGALVDSARPRRTRPSVDPVKSTVQRRTVLRQPRERTDEDARIVLSHLHPRLTHAVAVLERMPMTTRTSEVQRLLVELKHHSHAAATALEAGRRVKPQRATVLERHLRRHPRLVPALVRFVEDVYATAKLTEAVAHDLIRLGLWRNRPQLYEVWVLMSLLRWLEARGYDVEPLELTTTFGERSRWNLSYAKASKPCAMVHDGSEARFVFYQLFRQTKENGPADMPDISLLDGASPTNSPIWAVDPKHADRKGYKLADYRSTGTRYAARFGAKQAVVVEYYPREDLPTGNPYPLGSHAILVKDASPRGRGMPLVLTALERFHPVLCRTVLCVDLSSSFSDRRERALDEVRSRVAGGTDSVRDVVVWFALVAVLGSGGTAFAAGGDLGDPPSLADGTSLNPLVDALRPLVQRGRDRVIVVGDGEFDDPSWKARLELSLGVSVEHHP